MGGASRNLYPLSRRHLRLHEKENDRHRRRRSHTACSRLVALNLPVSKIIIAVSLLQMMEIRSMLSVQKTYQIASGRRRRRASTPKRKLLSVTWSWVRPQSTRHRQYPNRYLRLLVNHVHKKTLSRSPWMPRSRRSLTLQTTIEMIEMSKMKLTTLPTQAMKSKWKKLMKLTSKLTRMDDHAVAVSVAVDAQSIQTQRWRKPCSARPN